MEAMTMQDLKVGWWGAFDPLYGPEKVLSIRASIPSQGVQCFAHGKQTRAAE